MDLVWGVLKVRRVSKVWSSGFGLGVMVESDHRQSSCNCFANLVLVGCIFQLALCVTRIMSIWELL